MNKIDEMSDEDLRNELNRRYMAAKTMDEAALKDLKDKKHANYVIEAKKEFSKLQKIASNHSLYEIVVPARLVVYAASEKAARQTAATLYDADNYVDYIGYGDDLAKAILKTPHIKKAGFDTKHPGMVLVSDECHHTWEEALQALDNAGLRDDKQFKDLSYPWDIDGAQMLKKNLDQILGAKPQKSKK